MNPRLREVYMNAISKVLNLPDGGKEVDRMYIPEVFAEVFADQIVRECARVAADHVGEMEGVDFGLEEVCYKHFGLK